MSGSVRRLVERTAYDYSSLNASLTTGEIALATDVDISGSRETTLLVRIHSGTFQGAASSMTIVARASAPTSEDPATFFRDPVSTAISSTTLPITGFPVLVRIAIPANAGGWLTVLLKATQGAVAGQTVLAVLSIDISLKD